MKILQKGEMPNGTTRTKPTSVQLEQWDSDYIVAAYPISNSRLPGALGDAYTRFRLAIRFDLKEDADECFEALTTGRAPLEVFRYNAEHPELVDYILHGEPPIRKRF